MEYKLSTGVGKNFKSNGGKVNKKSLLSKDKDYPKQKNKKKNDE